jgi:hypothetical protein
MTIRTVTVAKIYYRLNVGRTDGEIIPLGVLARFNDKSTSCLVLIARGEINATDLAKMDWGAQQKFRRPFDVFKAEVDAAVAGGVPHPDLFAHLSSKFSWSMYVAPPSDISLPEQFRKELEASLTEMARPMPPPVYPLLPDFLGAVPTALARIAGSEFPADELAAYIPPAWVVGAAKAGNSIGGRRR